MRKTGLGGENAWPGGGKMEIPSEIALVKGRQNEKAVATRR